MEAERPVGRPQRLLHGGVLSMDAADEECRDRSTPQHYIDQVYERFLDRLDDLVRAHWLMQILNLSVFPEDLHARHATRRAHATKVAVALRAIGRLHPDILAPRTKRFLDTLLASKPERPLRRVAAAGGKGPDGDARTRGLEVECADDAE